MGVHGCAPAGPGPGGCPPAPSRGRAATRPPSRRRSAAAGPAPSAAGSRQSRAAPAAAGCTAPPRHALNAASGARTVQRAAFSAWWAREGASGGEHRQRACTRWLILTRAEALASATTSSMAALAAAPPAGEAPSSPGAGCWLSRANTKSCAGGPRDELLSTSRPLLASPGLRWAPAGPQRGGSHRLEVGQPERGPRGGEGAAARAEAERPRRRRGELRLVEAHAGAGAREGEGGEAAQGAGEVLFDGVRWGGRCGGRLGGGGLEVVHHEAEPAAAARGNLRSGEGGGAEEGSTPARNLPARQRVPGRARPPGRTERSPATTLSCASGSARGSAAARRRPARRARSHSTPFWRVASPCAAGGRGWVDRWSSVTGLGV